MPKADKIAVVSGNRSARISRWSVPLVIFLLSFIAFFPALKNGFVNWDDDLNLLTNPHYRGLGWEQLRWMFTTFHMSLYRPLTWMTLGLDYLLWGMNPFGYHLTSLFFHAANAVLFYFVCLRLFALALTNYRATGLGSWVSAGFAALVFAIHPLRVEPVAWASGRENVVSGFFFLLTVICYLRAAVLPKTSGSRWRWLGIAWTVYAMSLLSKAAGMTLPLVLLVLDVYPLRRLGGSPGKCFGTEARPVWWEKVPFIILGSGAGVAGLMAKYLAGSMASWEEYNPSARLAQATYGLAFYLWKTVLPIGLSPLNEVTVIAVKSWDWPFLLSGVAIAGISLCLVLARRRWPAGLACWLCYGAILAPVLGIAQSGPQLVADRYSYLSCLGWSILAGGGLLYLWRKWVERRIGPLVFGFGSGVAAIVVVGLGVLTWQQAQVWRDSERLWRHALDINPNSNIAYYNLGLALKTQGRLEEATVNFQQALKIKQEDVNARYNLGLVLADQGQLDEAIGHFRQVIQVDPIYVGAHYNLANSLVMRGQVEDAVIHYREAIRIDPAYAEAHGNLGNVLAMQGNLKKAVEEYREALRIKPDLTNTRFNLALAFFKGGLLKEAKDEFDLLLKAQPELVAAHYYLGNILIAQGDLDKGTDELKEAVRLQPDFADAHVTLARLLALQGKRAESVRHYEEALRILRSRGEKMPH